MPDADLFQAKRHLQLPEGPVVFFDIGVLEERGEADIAQLPFVEKILLENLVRHADGETVTTEHAHALARGEARSKGMVLPLHMSRVILQDGSGLPLLMDLAAQRDALARRGIDPERARPALPAEIIVDHSVHTDVAGVPDALRRNLENEYERNRERFAFLKWAQQAIEGLRVIPPGNGIIHQINLEYLSRVVARRQVGDEIVVSPETLVGTDSHTTMINGLGVLGWGVGGIEAQSVLLGEPRFVMAPAVVGVRLEGVLREGVTPTDLVLTLTELLRRHNVTGSVIEFCGGGLETLSLPDRATLANMAPEYGAAIAYFPVDGETLSYLRLTGRDDAHVDMVSAYTRAAGLFRDAGAKLPKFDRLIELNIATVEPSLAGPKRPHDRTALSTIKRSFPGHLTRPVEAHGFAIPEAELGRRKRIRLNEEEVEITHGSVVIAAITSCVNTSNPTVMIGAGLIAKKAVERGLRTRPWVRTSLAPGSRTVARYLADGGLMPSLEELGFYLVGFGCMSCAGQTGAIAPEIVEAIESEGLVVASVLSGNRNFEGRINPYARASYLASPMLVVVYALAGRVDIDFAHEPIGTGDDGLPVYLHDIWPSAAELREAVKAAINPATFRESYDRVLDGGPAWESLDAPRGPLFPWNPDAVFMCEPPYFSMAPRRLGGEPGRLDGARVLVMFGDSVTTDHIYPGHLITPDSAAGQYLMARGVPSDRLNSFTAGRGNHEVVARGTFANRRTRNLLTPEIDDGGYTRKWPEGEIIFTSDAAEKYRDDDTPVIVIAGRDYGTGSARDFAAKGPLLLGVRAVIAESFAPTHRWNLVGMGIVPLQFQTGKGREALGLTGAETYSIEGWGCDLQPDKQCVVTATDCDGQSSRFSVTPLIETEMEMLYLKRGGILPLMLARAAGEA